MNIGEHINGELQQPMPEPLQPYAQDIMDFQDSCFNFCQRIFQRFSEALNIDQDWFTSRHGPGSSSVFRFLWYPYVEDVEDGVDIRAGAHSDYGSITLLFQLCGQPGLEIKTPSGDWAPVPVDPRSTNSATTNGHSTEDGAIPILVNFGDLLEDWTGGLLKSTVHRVIFPKGGKAEDRYSIAYFCHPVDDAELVPVPSKLVQEHAMKTGKGGTRNGKVLTAKDHLMERLAATYTVR
jgi:isopenicillin N synthase-like dioxygenase